MHQHKHHHRRHHHSHCNDRAMFAVQYEPVSSDFATPICTTSHPTATRYCMLLTTTVCASDVANNSRPVNDEYVACCQPHTVACAASAPATFAVRNGAAYGLCRCSSLAMPRLQTHIAAGPTHLFPNTAAVSVSCGSASQPCTSRMPSRSNTTTSGVGSKACTL